MTHRTTLKFWSCYEGLPEAVQRLADENFGVLKENPRHPSLQFKVVGSYWSVRIGIHYRALAIQDGDDVVWFWIGHHSAYDKLVGR